MWLESIYKTNIRFDALEQLAQQPARIQERPTARKSLDSEGQREKAGRRRAIIHISPLFRG